MKFLTDKLAVEKFRWVALAFIAMGLAIVIIDNTVLVVAIPYMLTDLHTTFSAIQWVVSGYSLIIATLLITMGRLGDVLGRKRVFLTGVVLFAIGSFTASISPNATILFLGEALIEAFGASMMLTSALAIIADEFRGSERAIAFGIWGSIAGASASVGPLLGGYLTTFYSWRWSFRINVIVAIIALLGSVFIRESKGESEKSFDWKGTLFSAVGLFSLVFAVIEGRLFGWITPTAPFSIGSFSWPFTNVSIIPFMFLLAAVSLTLFLRTEWQLEQNGRSPLLRLSIFRKRGFSMGLMTLMIISFGQFGIFFIMPIFLQNVLGLSAFQTGLTLLFSSVSVFIFGPLSGYIATKIHPRYIVNAGMIIYSLGTLVLAWVLKPTANSLDLGPALILFGIGIGMASSQLNNLIISSIPINLAGEASASSATMRQIGSSVGSAIISSVLAATLASSLITNINQDQAIPAQYKKTVMQKLSNLSPESINSSADLTSLNPALRQAVEKDLKLAMTDGAKAALYTAMGFMFVGMLSSFLLPLIPIDNSKPKKDQSRPVLH